MSCKELLAELERAASEIRRIEAEAENVIQHEKDQSGYAALMREKALLLSGLAEEVAHCFESVPDEVREFAQESVERFSASASMSLDVDSVFFMSALLYDDDHDMGDPNNLELLIGEIRMLCGE